jgi:exosortase/archaeosortase family protein
MQNTPASNRKLTFVLSQTRLVVAAKFSVIVAVVVAFYLQDLNLVFRNAISDESTYHILAIPVLFGYLLYRKRRMAIATLTQTQQSSPQTIAKHFSTITGAFLCAAAVLVYWFGSYTFTPIEYHMLTLPVFVAGLILVLFNAQTLKHLAFPVAFLFFLTPPPTEILYSVGSTLSDLSAHASNALANVFGIASTISAQYGSPIITITRPDQTLMNFSVDVACSGVYSLIGFVIFAVFIAYITRAAKLWNKILIFALGIPLIIVLNIFRITTILAIGNSYGDQLALQVFHALGATVLMFIGTLILLITTDRFIKKPKTSQPCQNCATSLPKDFCLNCGKILQLNKIKLTRFDIAKIASIAIAIGLLLSIQAPVFALTEGPAQVLIQTPTGLQPNTQILPLPQVTGYNLSYVYRDTSFEELSGEDASLVYAYGSSTPNMPTVWVAVELASTTGPLHRWETCLINYPISQGLQPKVSQLDLTDIQTQANPPIVGRFFAFQYHTTNQTQVVLYWYETATFTVNNQTQQKHVKISLVAYPKSTEDVRQYEEILLPIAKDINDYWQPIKTWTTVALTISQNGLALSAATIALLVALIIYRLIIYQQEKSSLLILYSKLPTTKQQLIQAVKAAQKAGTPTTQAISDQLNKQPNNQTTPEQLYSELEETQKVGLIEKSLLNKEDKPIYAWKSLLPQHTLLGSIPFISKIFK